jgi:hypothetical protein
MSSHVVGLVEPVAPHAAQAKGVAVASSRSPSGNLAALANGAHCLDRWDQVGVGREQRSDVELVAFGAENESDGKENVDALLPCLEDLSPGAVGALWVVVQRTSDGVHSWLRLPRCHLPLCRSLPNR